MSTTIYWAWKYKGRGPLFGPAFSKRADAIDYAVQRCISSDEYRELETNARRWRLARRRGHRVVKVKVVEL